MIKLCVYQVSMTSYNTPMATQCTHNLIILEEFYLNFPIICLSL
jgi:hypothetical protein